MPEDTGKWLLRSLPLPLSLVTASALRTLLHRLLEQIKKHFLFLPQIHLTVIKKHFLFLAQIHLT